jgi:hypothetical protein
MKTKVAFLTFLAAATVSCAWAQSTEDDDMYFTSKDRVAFSIAQNASRQAMLASTDARRITESEVAPTINPTDSYSARNVNPEYISGAKVGSNSTTTAQYFSPNYQPTSVNQNLASNSSNCNCNMNSYNGFNNYGYNRFGSFGSPYGMSGMSPYGYNSYGMNPYSSFYDPYGMSSGFYQPGLSFGLGSGFGNSFGFGNSWGSPSSMFWNSYYGGNSFYGGGFGNPYGNSFYNPYGYGYSSYNSGYGSRTVVVADRPSRTSARNQEIDRYYTADRTTSGGNSGGRVATQDYYNRGWRNDVQQANQNSWNTRTNQNSNAWNSGWNNNNTNTGWNNNNQNSGWGNSGGRSFSAGGGGGSSGGGSAGGGGGSRRGRD